MEVRHPYVMAELEEREVELLIEEELEAVPPTVGMEVEWEMELSSEREEEEEDTWVPHVSGCGGERTEAAVEIWRVEIESLLEEIS